MNPNKERLVAMVKASAQELIDRAEDLVGEADLLSRLDITIRCPVDGEIPAIEVTKEYISRRCLSLLVQKGGQ